MTNSSINANININISSTSTSTSSTTSTVAGGIFGYLRQDDAPAAGLSRVERLAEVARRANELLEAGVDSALIDEELYAMGADVALRDGGYAVEPVAGYEAEFLDAMRGPDEDRAEKERAVIAAALEELDAQECVDLLERLEGLSKGGMGRFLEDAVLDAAGEEGTTLVRQKWGAWGIGPRHNRDGVLPSPEEKRLAALNERIVGAVALSALERELRADNWLAVGAVGSWSQADLFKGLAAVEDAAKGLLPALVVLDDGEADVDPKSLEAAFCADGIGGYEAAALAEMLYALGVGDHNILDAFHEAVGEGGLERRDSRWRYVN